MAPRIDSVKARTKLSPSREPYWHKLATGQALGYRKMSATSEGQWWARLYDPDTKKLRRKALGELDHLPEARRYDEAKKQAEQWFTHLSQGGSAQVVTVAEACAAYVSALRAKKRVKSAADAEGRFRRYVDNDPLCHVELSKLTKARVDAWRARLEASEVQGRERAAATTNRDMSVLRAALNAAKVDGHITSDAAWSKSLAPIDNADKRRDVYLDLEQRRTLIEHAPADLALLLRGMSALPLRPGALAALKVDAFDKRLAVLRIGVDKAGRDRKFRVPAVTAKFLAEQCEGKLTGAWMFTRADGKPWGKDAWKKPFKDAAKAAGLPATTVLYSIRHSTITDLIHGGLDILTTAQLSGTSVAMIEKFYGHLRQDRPVQALAALAL